MLTLLVVLAGGLPIAWAVLRFAIRQRRGGLLALLAVPLCGRPDGGAVGRDK